MCMRMDHLVAEKHSYDGAQSGIEFAEEKTREEKERQRGKWERKCKNILATGEFNESPLFLKEQSIIKIWVHVVFKNDCF